MATKPLGARSLAFAALVAFLAAGAGTWAAMRYTHTPVPPLPPEVQAAPAKVKRVTGQVTSQMRQLPATLRANSPARLVERARGAIGVYGPVAPAGAGGGAAPAPAAPAGGWQRTPLGRGVILERK